MEELMKVVKECNASFDEAFNEKAEELLKKTKVGTEAEMLELFKKISSEADDFIKPFYERIKEQVSLEHFASICLADMQYNFIGGAVVNFGEDTIVEIK
jgi:hypothetical protein